MTPRRDLSGEIIVALFAIGVLALALVFGIVLTLSRTVVSGPIPTTTLAQSPTSFVIVQATVTLTGDGSSGTAVAQTTSASAESPTATEPAEPTTALSPEPTADATEPDVPSAGDLTVTAVLATFQAPAATDEPTAEVETMQPTPEPTGTPTATVTTAATATSTEPPTPDMTETAAEVVAALNLTATAEEMIMSTQFASEAAASTGIAAASATSAAVRAAETQQTAVPTATEPATLSPTAVPPTHTPHPTATHTASATQTPLPSATSSPTPQPTFTVTASPTLTASFTASATSTASLTATATATVTHTSTPTFTPTFTRTPTATFTSTATRTPTRTSTPSHTPTRTPTRTPTLLVATLPTATPTLSIPTLQATLCAVRSGWIPYIVQPGDTLFSIARQAGVTLLELQRSNCIPDASRIVVGQVIVVPPGRLIGPDVTGTPPGLGGSNIVGCDNAAARLIAPLAGATVRGVVTFAGAAVIPNFAFYKLEVRPESSPNWTTFVSVPTPQPNGTLGTLDTSAFAPGLYWVQLLVIDQTGNYPIPPCAIRLTFQS